MSIDCLISSAYCPSCGQTANVERFRYDRALTAEFFLGVFSIERGFFYTCKEMLYRPGHVIRDYVAGQRNKYFHFITLLLVLLAISITIKSLANHVQPMVVETDVAAISTEPADREAVANNSIYKLTDKRLLLFLLAPLAALAPALLLRRMGYTLAEHTVIVVFVFSFLTLLGIFSSDLLKFLPISLQWKTPIEGITMVFELATLGLLFWQLTSAQAYNRWARLRRVALLAIILVTFAGIEDFTLIVSRDT